MEDVRVDPPLDDAGREVDPLGGEQLDERFGDDPPAHVAPLGAGFREVPGFIDVHGQVHPDPFRHLEEKIRKEGARGSSADHGDTGTVVEE
jgi:hypothetical protein